MYLQFVCGLMKIDLKLFGINLASEYICSIKYQKQAINE